MPNVPSPDSMPARIVRPEQQRAQGPVNPPAGRHNRAPFRNPQQPGRGPDIHRPNAGFPKVTVRVGEMPRQEVRPPRVDVVSAQRQQSGRVPFEDRFPAGVRAVFDNQEWESTGGRDHMGRLVFRPEGGGELRAIDAAMLQAKGAFPLKQEGRKIDNRRPQHQEELK